MRIKKAITILSLFTLIILVTGCSLLFGPKEITIMAYPDHLDPAQITEGSNIHTILKITPAINGKSIFVTDAKGKLKFKISEVPDGDYFIHPVFCESGYDRVMRTPDDNDIHVVYPAVGIICATVNVNSAVSELQAKNVRSALADGIARGTLLANTSTDGDAALFLIPPEYRHDNVNGLEGVYESVSQANTSLQNESNFSFNFLHHNEKAALAAELKSQWENLTKVDTVTTNSRTWENYKLEFKAKTFDTARWGWVLDSNNLLSYLKNVAEVSGYTDLPLTTLFTEAGTALEQGNLTTHAEKIVEINNYLNDKMCTIPLFYIDP